MTSIAVINRDKIINHLQQGGKLDDLHLGVSRQAISQALKDDPEYQAAQVEYHAARLDKAEQAILDASDNVDVARARALHQAYAWRAEREQRRIWGQQPSVVVMPGADIRSLLDEREARIAAIDGQCETVGGEGKADV